MNLECNTIDGLIVVRVLDERIDSTNVQGFRDVVDPHLAGGACRVLVDLQRVEYIDSSGLGALVSLFRRLPSEGTLALCGLGERVDSLLKVTRLNKVFSLFETEQEALAQLGRP